MEYSSISNDSSEKRLEFESQIAKLENVIIFYTENCSHIEVKLTTLQDKVQKETLLLEELNKSSEELDVNDRVYQATVNSIKAELAHTISESKIILSAIYAKKQQITTLHKNYEEQSKSISKKESRIEELVGEKFSILRKCKLEDIKVTFEEGSLEDFSLDNSNIDKDVMDVDGQSGTQLAMDALIPNYKKLTRTQKENGSIDIENGFNESIKTLTSELSRIAPNMKAVDKLDEVEQKLRETAEEFDATRREAKDAKDKFNRVKEER